MKNLLIVKHGALGDVVRTAYFAKPLARKTINTENDTRIFWLTSQSALPLLRFNPYIDIIATKHYTGTI